MAGEPAAVIRVAQAAIDWTSTVDLVGLAGRHTERVRRAEAWIRDADYAGELWDRGLWADCLAHASVESRFSFIGAWPRSAGFGALIVGVPGPTSGHNDELRSDVGRLINLFVTTFDGICDEAPDLLPQVLPITDRVIGNFPEPWRGSLPVSDPIPHLLLEVACTTARLIRETMEDVPRNQCELVSRAIRTAYEGQLNTLKQTPRPEPAASRTSLSGATFQVSLIVGALFVHRTSVDFRALVDAGEALGSLFGWIDDVVDLESDLIGMQPNMVAALIGTESGSESESIVRRETARRWREAQRALRKVESKADDAQRELLEAAVIWLGVVESADRCG